jgi:hypothetical protein
VSGEEDADDVRSQWLRHEYTQTLKKFAASSYEQQFAFLLGACAKSPDPEVRAEYQKYVERKATLLLFEQGKKK